jgi:hypothetical protein
VIWRDGRQAVTAATEWNILITILCRVSQCSSVGKY